MKQVKFIEVGRSKKTWQAECAEVDYDFLYKQVKKHGMVMSRDLDFGGDENGGTIFAGMHTIGKFEIAEVMQ